MGRHLAMALLLCRGGVACAPTRGVAPQRQLPIATQPKEVLPPDLDVALWLDLNGLRRLWLERADEQILRVLGEYGLISPDASSAEGSFWLRLLGQSERWWIACRPTDRGCTDPVIYAQGHYSARKPPEAPLDLTPPIDLGAGWFRYAARARVGRRQPARIYVAPPDRYVVVSPAEVDAVERSLEQGRSQTDIRVEERGLVSVTFRAPELGRALERRVPAAARFLRSAKTLRLWVALNSTELELEATLTFESHERALVAQRAFALMATALGEVDAADPLSRATADVVGDAVVLRLRVTPPTAPPPTKPAKPAPE